MLRKGLTRTTVWSLSLDFLWCTGRDGKILGDNRQDGNVEAHRPEVRRNIVVKNLTALASTVGQISNPAELSIASFPQRIPGQKIDWR